MREYILLADRLQDRIDDPDTRHNVAELGHTLKEALVLKTKSKKCEEDNQRRKEEFYQKFDTAEEADEFMRNSLNKEVPTYQPYLDSAKGFGYGLAACIAACFSRDASKILLRKKDIYKKISEVLTETIKIQKESKQIENSTIRQLSENEFDEARFIDNLRKKGCSIPDEVEYELVKKPELLVYAILNELKDKYAPEL